MKNFAIKVSRNVLLSMSIILLCLVILNQTTKPSIASSPNPPDFYTTGPLAELQKTIPITSGSPYAMRVIYSLKLDKGVAVNDLIDATVDMEVTNPYTHLVMYASSVMISTSPTATSGGQYISRPSGYNVDPPMHHGKDVRVGRVRSKYAGDSVYVNYIGWSAYKLVKPASNLIIEQNYGIMTVLNHGPVT